ncbi:Lead, cadmium, zinc and mercury transporting ATPase [Heyndrickxia sporothermodurans]|uniref:Lead, cadmium, zinc and mercury transporting ATPase n=1 Tax=Heyndrickxia sporothermodurans TaxID=46224 RepID=A0A150KTR4_9BACI|nr:heavy metal translocating P-type ATPase [Heyndrickxia sporothermodurans]KYD03505.1 Lead, cadmium, zinc and mercury transporting ATPase [Heyndrickxia sporothermodurans]
MAQGQIASTSREISLTESSRFDRLFEHIELIAALLSGLFIFIGWLSSQWNHETISIAFYLLAFIIGGYAKAKEGIVDTVKNKELNVEMLMILAAIGSAVIGYWTEGAILIFIFSLSGALETYTMNKSQKEISSLLEIQPETATRIIQGKEKVIHVSLLEVGDHIIVKPGERIPADGKIIEGTTTIDESTISGESVPVTKGIRAEVFAGTININGSVIVEVMKQANETVFQKIVDLVQSAQSEKSPSQLFIERFESMYVKIVLLVVLIMMIVPHFLFDWSWNTTFYRAMILLVVASPCALVASIMPVTLSAISNGARNGILFKGGVHLEALSHVKAIAFDKTGTLTKGKPEVTDIIVRANEDDTNLLHIIASIENRSNHPLARAIVDFWKKEHNHPLLQPEKIKDIPGWGLKGWLHHREWWIGKKDFVGKENALAFENGVAIKLENDGKTVVYVKDSLGIVAAIGLQDIVRKESKHALILLKNEGIRTIMLTGDSKNTARNIAQQSNIDEYIAECLPETKVSSLKMLKDKYGVVAMVGDGVNDAPALATANIGIAMGEGSDVAMETADVVLMKNDLSRIAEAIRLSKKMNRIIKQNIIFSLTVILLLIASNFLQFLNLPLGVVGHEGSTILVILNGLRCLRG